MECGPQHRVGALTLPVWGFFFKTEDRTVCTIRTEAILVVALCAELRPAARARTVYSELLVSSPSFSAPLGASLATLSCIALATREAVVKLFFGISINTIHEYPLIQMGGSVAFEGVAFKWFDLTAG
jgi:hypothetical protein